MSYIINHNSASNNNQMGKNVGEIISQSEPGDFTRMPNELLEYLYQSDLSPIEFKIIIYLARNLYGWTNRPFQKFQVKEIAEATGIQRNKIHVAINKLESKGLIIRDQIGTKREYYYSFSPNFFRQVIPISEASEKREQSQSRTINSPKLVLCDSPKVGLSKDLEAAPEAETQAPKDRFKDIIKDILKTKDDKITQTNWIQGDQIDLHARREELREQSRKLKEQGLG